MAVELKLVKTGGVPWGFKLSGGADMEVPLTVVKITDRTPAQDAGLQIGDVLFRVNETDLADLPHSQAMESIANSGETIVLNVFRGHLTDQQAALIAEEQSNEEVYQIMEGSIPIDYPERPFIEMEVNSDIVKIEQIQESEIKHDLNLTDEEIHSIINPEETMKIASQQETLQIEQESVTKVQHVELEQIQQETSTTIQQEESVTIHQEESVAIQQEESVAIQQEESVRIEQEESVAIQQVESVAIQQEESLTIQQEESGTIQQEAVLTIQQEEVAIEEQHISTKTSSEITSQQSYSIQEEYVVESTTEANEQLEYTEQRDTRNGFRSKHQNSVVDNSEILIKHEEIENIAGKIVEQMSKIQQKQEEEAAMAAERKIVEEDEQKENVVWKSQVTVEQMQKQQQQEVLKEVSGYLSQMELESRKWSTFLQKPKNPKPKVNYMEEPKKSTYRVVIRTKKDLEDAKKAAEEEAKHEAEEAARVLEEAARAAEEAERAEEEAAARAAEEAERLAFEEAEAKLREEENGEAEEEGLDENENVVEEENDEEYGEEHSRSEGTSKHMSGKDAVVTVEQQLAQVKEQLLALSELPSTIQMTLSIITEQLQKLAQEAQPLTEDDIRDDELSNADNTETEDEVTELLVLESQDGLSVVEEESENIRGESSMEAEEIAMEEEVVDTTKEDEEAEAKRLEEARTAKKEKEMQQPRQPLTPLERPIILPGGRKWSQPDDAVRSVRQPKLSDDKIDETISSYYEVITGKTIGINFLKYQPPPKNLDHLQKSEVYKMVHDMEPPARGITARPEKVAAVQDYLVKTNGEEEKQLPAQMER